MPKSSNPFERVAPENAKKFIKKQYIVLRYSDMRLEALRTQVGAAAFIGITRKTLRKYIKDILHGTATEYHGEKYSVWLRPIPKSDYSSVYSIFNLQKKEIHERKLPKD